MRVIYQLGPGGREWAGACLVYNAMLGNLLVLRRTDGHVDWVDLTIVPYFDGLLEEDEGPKGMAEGARRMGLVPFTETIRVGGGCEDGTREDERWGGWRRSAPSLSQSHAC